jgi:chemotaxis methyl-accepting protein methylase
VSAGGRGEGVDGAARLLARKVGLRLDPAIRGRLTSSVHTEAAARGLDLDAYVEQLHDDPIVLQDLLNRVTVQETAFFRDPGQFEALATYVLPDLTPPVTVWSAGCANGQEPYSLAMTLAEGGVDGTILATDVSTKAVGRTRRARYRTRELAGISEERRALYFSAAGEEWEVVAALRARVEVRHHNLVAEPPPVDPGQCQVVFCRNVLIYFEQREVLAFIEQLARWLAPDAWLFLGYSESLWQVTDRFALVRMGESFVYRQRSDRARLAGVASGRRSTARRRPAAAPTNASPPGRPPRPPASASTTAPRPPRAGAPQASEPVVPVAAPSPDVVELFAVGEEAVNRGDLAAAVVAFRKCAYLDPDQPIAHLHLGLALEASGDQAAARRAYLAAREALTRSDTGAVEAILEGYRVDELTRMLDDRLARP